ncbi:helix-turn-helix transcriptional regulator [Enterococcus sp. HY326]|uniref:helix-turn-helix transcriptional regulator n=1 Tax=Enterococcus sp. HY326 TaxID=2971265 RepID=UPI00223FA1C8|nr:helix-turn-helix transcriptional regulator [Enterococcus sp. HY326]
MTVTIGEQLKKIRSEHNLTQAEVAEKLKVSRQTLSKWELDKSLPDLQSLTLLAAFYNFSVDDLLGVAKERKKMLQPINKKELQQKFLSAFNRQANLKEEKEQFIQQCFADKLATRPDFFKNLYWLHIVQEAIIPGYFGPYIPTINGQAQQFLKLFPTYNYQIYWLNENGIGFFSIMEWLEEEKVHFFPFTEMKYVVFGKAYSTKLTAGNPWAFAYRTQQGNYDFVPLKNPREAEDFKTIIASLDSGGEYFKVLTEQAVIKYIV